MKSILIYFLCLFLLRENNANVWTKNAVRSQELEATVWTKQSVKPVDPKTFDYCKVQCKIIWKGMKLNGTHSACGCEEIQSKNQLLTDNIYIFRKLMLDIHNEGRNRIANGLEPECPKASNMMLLNYDLELEYIAGCYLKKMEKLGHDTCRKKQAHSFNAGQNLYALPNKPTNLAELVNAVKKGVETWYQGFKNVSNISKVINKFENIGKVKYNRFTQFVWGSLTHIGCGRAWHNAEKQSFVIVCNYAGKNGGGNIIKYPVYVAGQPCTKCHIGTKCLKRDGREALCGQPEPIPDGPSPNN